MCQAMDEVEDALKKLKRDPWARAASADVAEEGVAVVVVIRSRNLLSSYAILTSTVNNTPLPCHFIRDGFTIAALDNFDFHDNPSLSGKCSTHDAALVLFQDCSSGAAPGKMVISEKGTDKRSCKLVSVLPC